MNFLIAGIPQQTDRITGFSIIGILAFAFYAFIIWIDYCSVDSSG